MYQLVQAHLVQFFLFQAQTLQFERSTAIIAPNGAGKSALLDALQIVLLGADNRHLRFNAQAGGQARARSIRDYCLGVHRPGSGGRVRETATTYISLVFRHDSRDEVLTAGVALSASAQEPEHRLNGLYLLPGVALELHDHLEWLDGQQLPLTWNQFREHISQTCKAAGQSPILETRSERFVRELLLHLRPAGSSGSDLNGYRKALRNALNLKNQDDIDLFVRTLVAEERPTDVARFRGLLDTFGQIKDKIDRVVLRITQAEAAEKKYQEVERRAIRAASALALAAEYSRDAHAEQLEQVEAALHAAAQARQQAAAEAETQALELKRLRDRLEQVQLQLSGLGSEARQAQFDALSALQRQQLDELGQQLRQQAETFCQALSRLQQQPETPADPALGALQQAWQTLRQSLDSPVDPNPNPNPNPNPDSDSDSGSGSGSDSNRRAGAAPLPAETAHQALLTALRQAQPALDALQQQAHERAAALENLRSQIQAARTNQSRMVAGQSELRPEAARLLAYLEEAGIPAQPVSDRVQVRDPAWQTAIEAYLGPHLDALLIAPEHEAAALALYRNLKGARTVYGVKLALASQARKHPPFAAEDALAGHLVGDPDAVAYLARQLGKLRCVHDEKHLLQSTLGLSADGFLAKGGGIERLRLPTASALRIGANNQRARQQALREEITRLENELQQLGQQQKQLQAPLQVLARAGDALAAEVQTQLLKYHDLRLRLDSQARDLAQAQDPDLLRLCEQRDALRRAIEASESAREAAIHARALADGEHERLQRLLQALEQASQTHARRATEAFRDPDVDPNQVERYRAELDEKYPASLLERRDQAEARATRAGKELAELLRDAWPLLQQYAQDHALVLELDSGDWRGARRLLAQDLEQLRESELERYQQQANEAYRTAVETFRSSVAHTLHDNFVRLDNQINTLNRTLRRSPPFSNNERYEFRKQLNPEYADLHRFIERATDIGETDTLFGHAGQVPAAFRELVEDQASGRLAQSPLDDYRRFFHFQVVIKQNGEDIGHLGERMRSGSGGEHRAPLYVIAGAALAAAYGKGDGQQDGLGLILLDEFGDKIDAQNARATTDYLRSLGLQLVVAAPDTAQGTLSGVLDHYIELFRDGPLLHLTQLHMDSAGRHILESDQFGLHPELLAAETAQVLAEQKAARNVTEAGVTEAGAEV